ncbi:ent-Kaurenoic acid hydroxylase [Selaginella moellendorffii]|uniref:Ent-Kaurenoic acid hydroxylase n=1 Tax=Selaginella moellendorffii TaxID=88036 RepID=D8RWT8_SELML|nr:ent-kaurenoic acid oxidase 2 isoform X1 [Selaginella moellendorffii]XP_024536266.1 ent-kaurenoic acid oxidase 2 isoform X1 [Selaginella moellendorffii]EFJ23311.1 ent-Kaurenoic acid hydroxylase [Selaginella moellendorffii]|eukprot:XP_002975682.1 ent-kaurenoic acid oxidase 2 isoform X1 [Selaginella moellendorffii]
MNLKWAIAIATVAAATFFELLRNFNRFWYEPKLKPGQAPLPPGSLGWPIFGNMASFLRAFKSHNPDSFITNYLHKYDRTGVYKAFLFWQPTVLATTPETCKVVLSRDSLFETGWPSSTRRLIGTRSFAGVTGEEHLKLRRLTEPALSNPKALEDYIPRMSSNIKSCLEEWSCQERTLLLKEMRKYAFRTIHDILFSKDSGLDVEEVSSIYYEVNQGIRSLPINLPGTSYNRALKARKKLDVLLHRVLNKRRFSEKPEKTDTLSLLMDATDENGKHLDDKQIVDLLVMYLNAGHDSTAHLILWLLIFLLKHEIVYDKVKEEQELIASQRPVGESLSLSDVKKMSYLSRVINETLRVANISPMVFRRAVTDVEVNGFTIPKGWYVEPWLRQVHMDPAVHSNPQNFDPDRWARNEVRPFTHLPFGLGSRTCPGNELAKLEACIIVHHLVLGYDMKPLNPDCEVTFLPHPRPKDYFPVQVRRRR